MILKYHHTDEGLCRVYFTTQGIIHPKNTYYYCLQEEDDKVKLYSCSNTSNYVSWEPECPVTFTGPIDIALPAVGKWDEYTESIINRWVKKRKCIHSDFKITNIEEGL